MCIAVSAKILELCDEARTAKAEFNGSVITVNARLVSVKPGDYVLIHAGCAIERISRESADEVSALYEELFNEA